MLLLSVLLLMKQDCGGPWRSGKSSAKLRKKEIDEAHEMLMRVMTIHLYIYIYVYIYIYIYNTYIYIYT